MQFNSHADQGVLNLAFDPAQIGNPTATYSTLAGSSFASFLLGDVNKASVSEPNNTYGRQKAASIYASDDITVSDRLTVNIDLRWNYNGSRPNRLPRSLSDTISPVEEM